MTLREFLEEYQLEAVEVLDTMVFNLISDGASYAMDIDTSSIMSGLLLERREDFVIDEYFFTVGEIILNLDESRVLVYQEII